MTNPIHYERASALAHDLEHAARETHDALEADLSPDQLSVNLGNILLYVNNIICGGERLRSEIHDLINRELPELEFLDDCDSDTEPVQLPKINFACPMCGGSNIDWGEHRMWICHDCGDTF